MKCQVLAIISILLITLAPLVGAQASSGEAGLQIATFAGGCFWCMEPPFEKLSGVKSVVSGYTGGSAKNPTYEQVSEGGTGHYEAVQITYDPKKVSYDDLLQVLWRNIDPTDNGGQFVDQGESYRPAIFFHNAQQKKMAQNSIEKIKKLKVFAKPIVIAAARASQFYPAEEKHQDYYKKNPVRYKYYRYRSGRDEFIDKVWGKNKIYQPKKGKKYVKPAKEQLIKQLTKIQYKVTQKNGTERPFKNEYWDNKQEGIYVDVVSGEPLFSSKDKFKSGTGWPSFTKPLVKEHIVEKEDNGLFTKRTEVRSKNGDSHLGHVFKDGPQPTGLRYCINSASLRFIAKKDLAKEGYAEFTD